VSVDSGQPHRENKSAAQENLIWQLNPVIRGWVNYHRHITASAAFHRIDWAIWESLWFGLSADIGINPSDGWLNDIGTSLVRESASPP
jgi:hypothetical protein